jgi:K+-sensing histidine kinase KdpD
VAIQTRRQETPPDQMKIITQSATAAVSQTPSAAVPVPTGTPADPTPRPITGKQVFAVVRGDPMDGEVVKMACIFARAKQAQIVAMYGIEVPRKNELEASMPAEEARAAEALQSATTVAERYDSDIETEMVKTRKFSLSVVEEANRCACTLLVLGVPYQEKSDGTAQMDAETDYILEHALCRVVLIRGNKQSAPC